MSVQDQGESIQRLQSAARLSFPDLREAEAEICRASAVGAQAGFGDLGAAELEDWAYGDRPDAGADCSKEPHWPIARQDPGTRVRGAFITWLLTGEQGASFVHPRGVRISHALIEGDIDLAYCVVSRPVSLHDCVLRGHMDMLFSTLKSVSLLGTRIVGGNAEDGDSFSIKGDGANIAGGLYLFRGFRADKGVYLRSTTIRADLNCRDGLFFGGEAASLSIDKAHVHGSVYINRSAQLQRQPNRGFLARRPFRGINATIDHDVNASGGTILARDDHAVRLGRSEIGGTVYFGRRDGADSESDEPRPFVACGQVNLVGCKITNSLYLRGGVFRAHEGGSVGAGEEEVHAVNLTGVTVGRALTMCLDRGVKGSVQLQRASVGVLDDSSGIPGDRSLEWPREMRLRDFHYATLDDKAPKDVRLRTRRLWDAMQHQGPDPQPFQMLASVYRRLGYDTRARTVMCKYGWYRYWPRVLQRFEEPANYAAVCAVLLLLTMLVVVSMWEGTVGRASAIGLFLAIGVVALCSAVSSPACALLSRLLLAGGEAMKRGVYGLVVGHGYARWLSLLWLGAVVLIGAWIFGSGDAAHMQPTQAGALRSWEQAIRAGWSPNPSSPGTIADFLNERGVGLKTAEVEKETEFRRSVEWLASYPAFNKYLYSADAFIPLVSFRQQEFWVPAGVRGSVSDSSFARRYLPFHISIGWVIVTLFAASFTGLMRQEG